MSRAAPEQRLALLIESASGNVVPPGHYPFLARIAQQQAQARGLHSAENYVAALERGALAGEWRELLPRITVKESYLFRTPQQFEAISRVIVPALVEQRAASRRLRAWSAGCARGEEPATLAMVLAEHPMLVGWDWRIAATDIDTEALAQARRGIFPDRAVARLPEELRQRYLAPCTAGWQLAPTLLQRIDHHPVNLVHEPLHMAAAPFDLILLRNVLIYFQPASQRRVASAIATLLAADGALFLGPAETLWQVATALAPVDAGGCFYYRHAAAAPTPAPRPPRQPRTAPAAPRPAPVPHPAAPPLQPEASPGQATANPERLRRAAEAAGANRLDLAASLVEEALLANPRDPAAHILEGFLHDLQDRPQLAIAAYRAALFLEPGLAQVRLLLALCLRRLGWEERCRLELRQALASLVQEGRHAVAELAFLGVPADDTLRRRLLQALECGTKRS